MVHHYFLKNLGKEAKIRHWPVILHAILIEGGFYQKGGGGTYADLKCEGKEPSVTDKLTISVIGVIKMSMHFFTRLAGIGSKSENLNGARRTRWRTSSASADFVELSWYQEGATHESVSQRGRKSE